MSKPKRIQLRRTKGWRKPVGAVVVSRPSVWGNPFRAADYHYPRRPVRQRRERVCTGCTDRVSGGRICAGPAGAGRSTKCPR